MLLFFFHQKGPVIRKTFPCLHEWWYSTVLTHKIFPLSLPGTGFIGLEEFNVIVRRKLQEDEDERELKEMFRILDKEKKGEVNVNELRWVWAIIKLCPNFLLYR